MEKSLVPEEKARELRLRYLQKFAGLTEQESRDLVEVLTASTPKEWIKERPARGGTVVPYVPGPYFIQRFNDAFGFLWSYEVPEYFEKDGQIVTKGRWSLNIPGRTIMRKLPDGTEETIKFEGLQIVKEQFGSSEVKRYAKDETDRKTGAVKHKKGDVIDLGDDYKGAGTDAMKKCGTQLGMFLDVYGPRESAEEAAIREQFETLYWRGEQAGMTKDETDAWAEKELGKPLSEADELEVMGLVPKLIEMAKEKK